MIILIMSLFIFIIVIFWIIAVIKAKKLSLDIKENYYKYYIIEEQNDREKSKKHYLDMIKRYKNKIKEEKELIETIKKYRC